MPFDFLPEPPPADRKRFKTLDRPIWTENKAKLIERYLRYFVFVTKHGNYIDGFAGPQRPENEEMWSAKLVLESEPKWLRKFFLFDLDKEQAERLERLKAEQLNQTKPARRIEIYHEDFNEGVDALLSSDLIKQTEATFCLLDQRTSQCHWSTVERLARYKQPGNNKIELFYFFPTAWLIRALKSRTRHVEVTEAWWGRDDWLSLGEMKARQILELMKKRFQDELGYQFVHSWPIYNSEQRGRILYEMIHATDHPQAPILMNNAYRKAVQPKETDDQLTFFSAWLKQNVPD